MKAKGIFLVVLLAIGFLSGLTYDANTETPVFIEPAMLAASASYDLDILLQSGSHVYVKYVTAVANWTAGDKLAVSNALATYIPVMWTNFWAINNSAYVEISRGVGGGGLASGEINRDSQGNIVSYFAYVSVGNNLPIVGGSDWLRVLLMNGPMHSSFGYLITLKWVSILRL